MQLDETKRTRGRKEDWQRMTYYGRTAGRAYKLTVNAAHGRTDGRSFGLPSRLIDWSLVKSDCRTDGSRVD